MCAYVLIAVYRLLLINACSVATCFLTHTVCQAEEGDAAAGAAPMRADGSGGTHVAPFSLCNHCVPPAARAPSPRTIAISAMWRRSPMQA
jgi:hypothetical protein